MAAAASHKDGAPDWTVAVAIRHARPSDAMMMKSTAACTQATHSSTHAELVFAYPCKSDECKLKGHSKLCATFPRHYAQYTVRDAPGASGLMYVPDGVLMAKGGWTLKKIKADQKQLCVLESFCKSQVGSLYRAQTAWFCNKLCCGGCLACCGCSPCGTSYWDVMTWKDHKVFPEKRTWFCSEFVTAALLYAGIVTCAKGKPPIDPVSVDAGRLVDIMNERSDVFEAVSMPSQLCGAPATTDHASRD